MLSGFRWLGAVVGLGLVACSGNDKAPGLASEQEQSGIIGGRADTTSHAVVGMVINNGALCTGSLLAPNLVLTARHCVAETGGQNGAIECGVSMFGPNYDEGEFVVTWDAALLDGITSNTAFGVSDIRTSTGTSVCGNDIALMILDANVETSAATPLVPRLDLDVETDETFDAVGYGIQNPNDERGETAGSRMRVGGNIVLCVGESECFGAGVTDTEWLAESHICQGDSGGPALDDEGRVIGVTSRSNEDCSAGLYTGVTAFKSLIINTAIDAAEAGGYEPPVWAGGTPPMDGGTPMDGGMPMDAGNPPDAGTPDAGMDAGTPDSGVMPDAGTPDAGRPDAGNMDAGVPDSGTAGRPAVDSGTPREPGSLGESCTGTCGNDLVCYAEDGDPPGICVPRCTTLDRDCPDSYRCSTSLGACVPDEESDDNEDDSNSSASCSCSLRPVGGSANQLWGSLATVAVGLVIFRRRRRA
jgi:MYXO-CTERM domain-containing protein